MGRMNGTGQLRGRCAILNRTKVSDGAGGYTETFNVKVDNVPSRKMSMAAPQDMVVAGQVRNHEYAEWYLDRRVSGQITGSHRIRDRENRDWEVLSVEQQDDVVYVKCRDVIGPENCQSE